MMANKYLIIIFVFSLKVCSAQNLIPNGDFELYSGCPYDYSQIDSALFWINPSTVGTPDYYNQCASPVVVGVPGNATGFQQAHSGGAYAGFYVWWDNSNNVREYIETPLSIPLTANAVYHFEMFVNLGNNFQYTTDDIGVYFSDTLVANTGPLTILPFTAQLSNLSGNVFDTLNWTLVSGNYTASGGENYIIIGNFKNDSNTTIINYNPGAIFSTSYLLVDDVSLTNITGINNPDRDCPPTVFPNPFKNALQIFTENNSENEIILYDLYSKEIFKEKFVGTAFISADKISEGIYIYELRNKNGIFKKGKVVKE
jgi:type IX secretion system substrate protein